MLKDCFRKKNTTMLYEHKELKKSPFQVMDEETKIGFDAEKLSPQLRKAYESMHEEVLSKKYGEPLDVATSIFKEFETKAYKAERLRDDLTGNQVLFAKKLDVMNEEFDTHIGAIVADLIFRQHTLRCQVQSNLQKVDNAANNPLTRMMVEEQKRTDHLIYVDTTLNVSDSEERAIKNGEPIDRRKIMKRSVQIAEKAHEFLKKLAVPIESAFSDPAYLRSIKIKTQIVDEKLARQLEKRPNFPIRPLAPGPMTSHLEPVVLGGVAFFLDHINQMVIPVKPV